MNNQSYRDAFFSTNLDNYLGVNHTLLIQCICCGKKYKHSKVGISWFRKHVARIHKIDMRVYRIIVKTVN